MPRSDSEAKIKNPGIPGLQGSILSWIVPSGAAGWTGRPLHPAPLAAWAASRSAGAEFLSREEGSSLLLLLFSGSSVLLGDTVRRGPEAQRAWASERMVQAATMGCTGEGRWAWAPSCDRRPFIKTANSFGRTLSNSSELYFTANHVHVQ